MIKSFRHKGLKYLFDRDDESKLDQKLVSRIRRRLSALQAVTSVEHLDVPGFNFHVLRGKPRRYTIHVNGPYYITFEFENGDAYRVDLENYH